MPVRTRHLAAAAGAAALLAVAGAATPASAAVQSNSTSTGYAAVTGTYTSVSSSWTQPTVTCGSQTSYTTYWVGLDGYNDSAMEQTGTEADCISGRAVYGAWWEVLPASQSAYSSVTVKGGDHLTATVTYIGSSNFTMTLFDSTQDWTKTTTHKGSSGFQNTSAEVITESTDASGSIGATGGGSVTFTGSTVNGGTLAAADPVPITTDDSTVTPITGGGTFTAKWGTGGGVGPLLPGRAEH
ncbi:G1 family glutamic endopeptidase [Streptantibioticus silvisoli]|uniref:G1 family endopeptidase n=1 Tax=Streptantibioticus silvisoli TaxID=2705255 RepID=A0ABT6W0K6_9ACTN|nr:G1 family glutamic endopeptidase [Streptantibioticus silvisoli]MDI5963243.1 G1 family endopeptidase [Streptantibioticus silvisoli]